MDKGDGTYLGHRQRNVCCRQHRLMAKRVEETPHIERREVEHSETDGAWSDGTMNTDGVSH